MTNAQIRSIVADAAELADTISDAPRGSAEWNAHFRVALPVAPSELLDALQDA